MNNKTKMKVVCNFNVICGEEECNVKEKGCKMKSQQNWIFYFWMLNVKSFKTKKQKLVLETVSIEINHLFVAIAFNISL